MQSCRSGRRRRRMPACRRAPRTQFQHHDDFLNLPRIFAHQWSPAKEVAPDNVISERYLRSEDPNARGLTLKEAIYIAIQNNPSLKASQLDPVASMETVSESNGTFDPNLTAQGDIEKTVVPVTSSLQTGGGDRIRAEILRLELRPQQGFRGHQWNLGRDLQQRSLAVEFGLLRRQSLLRADARTLALAAVAAKLRLAVRDYQRANRRVGSEAGAMDLRTGAAGFRAENRRRLLERRAVRGKSRGRARRAALQPRPRAAERDQRQGRHPGADRFAGSAVGGRHFRGQRVHRRGQSEKFPHPACART